MDRVRTAAVLGAAGFIGGHLVRRLAREGLRVRAADIAPPRHGALEATEFLQGDLRDPGFAAAVLDRPFDEVYQLAADMGGAGYIFTGAHDAEILRNSAAINLAVLAACRRRPPGRLFYASSACIYPARAQADPDRPDCAEDSAYPAEPDSEYGWEKLFSERLYLAHARNHGLAVRIARFHNVFGPEGAFEGGREKAPAALCRKVAEAAPGGTVEVWGDGRQTRSFLHVDECIEGTLRLVRSDFAGPVNIGSEEMVTLNGLARLVIAVSGKPLGIRNVPGPTGVRGRSSDNRLIRARLGWAPSAPLRDGIAQTYAWIAAEIAARRARSPAAPAPAAPALAAPALAGAA